MTLERLPELVNGNAALVRRGRHFNADFLVEVGDRPHIVTVTQGRVTAVTEPRLALGRSWVFAVRASAEVWQRFWEPVPPPGYHDLIALLRYGRLHLEGNLQPLMANLLYVKLLLESLRGEVRS